MKESRYVPNGQLQGDDAPMNDHGNSMKGEYDNSLGESKRSDLHKGYCDKGNMKGTDSDKGFA